MAREKTLNPREAAQRLKIGMQRLYMLLYSGKLRATKQGRRWAIPESAVVERLHQVAEFQKLHGASAYERDRLAHGS